jgi:2-polyprenyl-3-methyl-5-hydroxy-6-metoxy-1,4-benzoquinol methylase
MKERKWLTIDQRTYNDLMDGRVDCWRRLVRQYSPVAKGLALEAGCAHAVLLDILRREGWAVAGIEPDPAVAQWIAEHCQGMGCAVGLFPDIVNTLPRCDVFLAMDVLEHVPDQTAFAAGVWGVLKPGGVAIIQTPMHEGVLWPPFHPRTLDAFESIEHLWIHTRASAAELFARAGLEIVNNAERWVNMHEIIILRRAT